MKPINITPAIIILAVPDAATSASGSEASQASYILGAVLALLILGYLIYSLLKPEKF
jgi:K+-transporting ATPase KdpF subunit